MTTLAAGQPSDAFNQVIWTLIVPVMFGAAILAIVLRILVDWFSRFLTRKLKAVAEIKRDRSEKPTFGNSVVPDPAVPHCPKCNSPMVMREARRGANQGQGFWGCRAYPECRGTRNFENQ